MQHFLLSAAARTLSLKTIFSEGEDAAYRRFRRLRWPETDGAPACPVCGCLDIYDLTTRRRFKCAACHHQFSVTSGTILASRKLSFVDLLGAVCLFVNASKGLSAVQLSRDLDVQYKTAFVLMHKLRARAGVRCSPHQPFRRLQPRRRPHQSGGKFLCPAPAHGRRAAPQSWRPASWRLCGAHRLVGGSSRSGQRRARRPLDRQGSRCARQPDLEGLLATTRSVTASPAAQTHIPLRFSTIRTNLRRLA